MKYFLLIVPLATTIGLTQASNPSPQAGCCGCGGCCGNGNGAASSLIKR